MSSRRRRERRGREGGAAERFISDACAAVGGPKPRGGAPPVCLLCGSPRVAYGGLWFPTDAVQAKLLTPSDKTRTIGYHLCEACFCRPDAARRAEDAILAGFAHLAADPRRN